MKPLNLTRVCRLAPYKVWTEDGQSHQPSPLDQKLRETILLLIEAFFAANPDILLYICETGDGRQTFPLKRFK